jgi:hypothetical protein
VAKAIALGADGAILGTAELVAIGCIRMAQCEKGLGCPFGITTTDPEQAKLINTDEAWPRIVNLYTAWAWQLAGILQTLGMTSISQLRGRSDLLVYLDAQERNNPIMTPVIPMTRFALLTSEGAMHFQSALHLARKTARIGWFRDHSFL